ADKDGRIIEMLGKTDAIAQQRTAGKGTDRIHSNDRDFQSLFATVADEMRGQRAFPRAGRPSDPQDLRFADFWKKFGEDFLNPGLTILGPGNQPAQRPGVSR